VDRYGRVTWPLRRTVHIDAMLGLLAVIEHGTFIVGYTEEANAVVLKVNSDDRDYEMYMVQLESMEYKKLEGEFTGNAYYPFARIYTGGNRQFFLYVYITLIYMCG
jgi:hypothetical protein